MTKFVLLPFFSFILILVFGGQYEVLYLKNENLNTISIDTCIGSSNKGVRFGYWQCWIDSRYSDKYYKNGKLYGIERIFTDFTKTKLYMIRIYKDGLRNGVQTSYHSNGVPHYMTTYKNGYFTYKIELDSFGRKQFEGSYVIDTFVSEKIIFDPVSWKRIDTILTSEIQSIPHGEWKYYKDTSFIRSYFYDRGVIIDSLIEQRLE